MTFRALLASLLIFSFATACSKKAAQLHVEPDIPHAQLGTNVTPTHYDLDLMIDPRMDTMSGVVTIDVTLEKPTQQIWLHGKEMTVSEAFALQGESTVKAIFTEIDKAQAPSGIARLDFDTPLAAGPAVLKLSYVTPYNTSRFSAYKSVRDGEAYIVTQFEPHGAREAFPSFDEPRFKVPFDLAITSPNADQVYANTPEIGKTPAQEGWTKHVFATTRPLPTYLIAFGAGPWDVVDFGDIPPNDIRKRPLALRGFAAKGSGDKFGYALDNTEGILTALERYVGSEYPYEKLDLIAAPEYAFGAMENPGAIVYQEYLLLLDDNAPLAQKRAYAGVHSHELAHQWFGNLVTPVWWEDIWLNEAFATWMGNKGTALWQPEGNFDRNTLNASLGAMSIDSLASTRKVREPLARTENVMDQFDGITYRKGGGVLSMFESFLGEEAFQKGVRLHMERYKDGVATGDDFFQSIADGSGNPDVVAAMKSFVDQPGLPMVSGSLRCEGETSILTLSQSRYAPLGSTVSQGNMWDIPVCAKLGSKDGTSKVCTLLKDKTSELRSEAGCADWVTLNENGAGYYRFSLDAAGWTALLKASDQLSTREILALQDSMSAAFSSGALDASVFISGMEILAQHPEYDVAADAGDYLGWFYQRLPEESRPALAKLTRDMYAQRYRMTAGTDTTDGNLLAPTLAARLIRYGDDQALDASFAGLGAAYLGLDGKAQKDVVPSNMLGRALSSVMGARSDDALPALLAMVKSGSPAEKGAALGALDATPDKAIAARLREMALSDTTALTGRQATSLIAGLMGSSTHGEETWAWAKANFDAFITTRVDDVRKPGMPALAGGFCDAERAAEVEAFMVSKAALMPGYERSLKQTLEGINLCAALKSAKAQEAAAALAAR